MNSSIQGSEFGTHQRPSPQQRAELRRWMIAQRQGVPLEQRLLWSEQIDRHLRHLLERLEPRQVGACWPFRAEHDLRPICAWLRSRGVVTALPRVLGAGQALQWRRWDETAALSADRMGLMFPADSEPVTPDLLLIPGNAFDDCGYRLGYGAGFFDITLARAQPRPIAVGVAYSIARVPDLLPQAYDLPMNWLVTEQGIESVDGRLGSV